MTKEELIALVRQRGEGGNPVASLNGKLHRVIVEKTLETIFTDLVWATYQSGERDGDYSQVDNYIKRYVQPVLVIEASGEKYCELPVTPVPLPDNFGLRQICSPYNQAQSFAPLDNVSDPVWAELEANYVDGTPGYKMEGNSIYFDQKFPYGLENVMLKIIVPFSALGDTEEVFVPGGNNTMIIEKAVQLILNEPPSKNQDDMTTKQA